jgi:hypothetical protein
MAQADTIMVLEAGRVVDAGSPDSLLRKDGGYVKKLGLVVPEVAPEIVPDTSDDNKNEPGWPGAANEELIDGVPAGSLFGGSLTDIRRKNGEFSVYVYYLASSGYTPVTLYVIFITLWIFCTEFSSR